MGSSSKLHVTYTSLLRQSSLFGQKLLDIDTSFPTCSKYIVAAIHLKVSMELNDSCGLKTPH